MKNITLLLLSMLMSSLVCSQSTLNLYSNYETIGLNVILSQNDPEQDAFATLQYKKSSSSTWRNGFSLSRIENDNNMLAGSMFWCDNGTNTI